MELILRVPALLAHSTLRFAAWREVIAEFVADRTGQRPDALAPQAIAHAVLGVAVAAYEQWLDDEDAELGLLLDAAMRQLGAAFAPPEPGSARLSRGIAWPHAGRTQPGAGLRAGPAYWPDVEHDPRQLLVVPVGSLEQHGPHLPLDTDTRIAVAVARRACAGRLGVALAPPLPIGASGEHAAFPGTLSIGSEALASCLIELGRHASLHWPALLLVNGHGGNVTAVERPSGGSATRAAPAWPGTRRCPEGDAHAGRSETSIMLALAPGAVRMDAAERGDVRPLEQILPLLREQGVRAVSANGVLGDPAGASAAEGERQLARLVKSLSGAMDQFLERRPV